jgi:hypothetical protein
MGIGFLADVFFIHGYGFRQVIPSGFFTHCHLYPHHAHCSLCAARHCCPQYHVVVAVPHRHLLRRPPSFVEALPDVPRLYIVIFSFSRGSISLANLRPKPRRLAPAVSRREVEERSIFLHVAPIVHGYF